MHSCLRTDAAAISPEYLTSWAKAADHGIETVAFTFLVHHCRKSFCKAKTLETRATLVEEVRQQVTVRHKVALTQQMEEHLQEIEMGKRTGDEHAKRQAAATSGSK